MSEQHNPYAWVDIDSKLWNHRTSLRDIPLYTKPEWQGLTDEELQFYDIGWWQKYFFFFCFPCKIRDGCYI